MTKNITDPLTGQVMLVNVTKCCGPVEPTELRLNQEYIKYYILIASTVLVALIPMLCMLITTLLIYQEMTQATRVAQVIHCTFFEPRTNTSIHTSDSITHLSTTFIKSALPRA